jgi:rubrerythrin
VGKFRSSQTAKNLLISFAAEAQAQTRYTFFSKKAEEDGYIQIAAFFKETADQEQEHALRFFKFFNGGELEITASYPTGAIKRTYDNLVASADVEKQVGSEMYPEFARVAREEGFLRAADTWDAIAIAERQHEKSFLALAHNIDSDSVVQKSSERTWKCRNCGYLHTGTAAPDKCPACVRPAGHFELLAENW